MKRTKQVKETVVIGGETNELRIVGEHDGSGVLASIVVDGWELALSPEDVERVAAALEKMRNDRGDYRRVCVDHGYHHVAVAGGAYGCPQCRAAEECEREQAENEKHAAAGAAFSRASL